MKFNLLFTLVLIIGSAAAADGVEKITINNIEYSHTKPNGIDLLNPVKAGDYSQNIDFALLERKYPIKQEALDKLTPDMIKQWDMESLDQLYARLSSGPIPDGPYEGAVMATRNGGLKKFQEKVKSLARLGNVDEYAGALWSGKYFYRDQMLLKNVMQGLLGVQLFGGKLVQAYPAKLFCGQSLLDSRRESIIIDYSQAETLDGPGGKMVGKNGLGIRDEIRMVRPGFYLGRAYANKVFLTYFTVKNEKAMKAGERKDACWSGNQARNF